MTIIFNYLLQSLIAPVFYTVMYYDLKIRKNDYLVKLDDEALNTTEPALENQQSENNVPAVSLPAGEDITLNGSWENNHRNITAAAITALLVIGVIYFNAQTLLAFVFILTYNFFFGIELSGGLLKNAESMSSDIKTPVLAALLISQYIFMLAPSLWITKKWHTSDITKYLRIRVTSYKEIILPVIITISLLPFCYYLSELLFDMLGIPESYRNVSEHLFAAKTTGQFIFLVFAIAVTPAICEEVFFRGYFQRTLERTAGAKSFIWGGILFGLFHMQPLSLITLSILGILFSFFFYKSKSLFPSSAAHFTNNFIALLLLYDQKHFGFFLNGGISFLLAALSLLAAAILLFLYIKISDRQVEENREITSNS